MRILAIESSCDETAAAIIEDGRKILSSVINTQVAEHGLYGGVVPEIASRRHTENIVGVVDKALSGPPFLFFLLLNSLLCSSKGLLRLGWE